MIRGQVDAGHPLILLIEDRPSRYHYVVAVGSDDEHVFVHDPTWGPSRRIATSGLMRRWKPTGFWTLLGTTAHLKGRTTIAGNPVPTTTQHAENASRSPDRGETVCDRLLYEALDRIEAQGPAVADEALVTV